MYFTELFFGKPLKPGSLHAAVSRKQTLNTDLSLNIVLGADAFDTPVLWVSFDSDPHLIAHQLLFLKSKLPPALIRDNTAQQEDWFETIEFYDETAETAIFLIGPDGKKTNREMINEAYGSITRNEIELFILTGAKDVLKDELVIIKWIAEQTKAAGLLVFETEKDISDTEDILKDISFESHFSEAFLFEPLKDPDQGYTGRLAIHPVEKQAALQTKPFILKYNEETGVINGL